MIVKFLDAKKADTWAFPGVRYNTDKTQSDRGELVLLKNFGALQGIENLRPEDYINYLKAFSSSNKRIKRPQLHAMISCRGREYTKEQLTQIAEKWLQGMGYGDNPFMLIYHKDTANNHIHIVSSRVGKDGKKIDDSFEWLRAYRTLDQILGRDPHKQVASDISDALQYHFATRAQFMLLLERKGYTLQMADESYRVSKFGKVLANVDIQDVDNRRSIYLQDKGRVDQLRAILEKYLLVHGNALYPIRQISPRGETEKITGYSSTLFEFLRIKFGLEAVFHFSKGKPPYGYTLIDHHTKSVFKGSDLLPLKKFQSMDPSITERKKKAEHDTQKSAAPYASGHVPSQIDNVENNTDKSPDGSESTTTESTDSISSKSPAGYENPVATEMPLEIDIQIDLADDIDDEAILGRNRRRKRKARTNTR